MAWVVADGRQRFGRHVQPALVLGSAWGAVGEGAGDNEPLHDLVRQARRQAAQQRNQHPATAHEHAADWPGGRSQDGGGDYLRRVDSGNVLRLGRKIVLGVDRKWRVDLDRLDQRDGDRCALVFQLHPQGLGETLDRELGRGICALQRHGTLGHLAVQVDDSATAGLLQLPSRLARAVDQAPVVNLEGPPHVSNRHLLYSAVDAGAGIVDPGVETAERFLCLGRDCCSRVLLRHVGNDCDGVSAILADLGNELAERPFAACREHEVGAGLRGHAGRGKADSGGGASDNDHLLVQGLQINTHLLLPAHTGAFTKVTEAGKLAPAVRPSTWFTTVGSRCRASAFNDVTAAPACRSRSLITQPDS